MIAMLCRTIWVLSLLIGVSLGFAFILEHIGAKIRGCGVGRWRKAYWYFVSPGVACHELGHCVGCWITGNQVSKVVFFTPNNDKYLGCVWHSCPGGLWGAVQSTIISSGPIWFGCLMIAALSKLLLGSAVSVNLDDYVECSLMPGILDYLIGCFRAGIGLCGGVLTGVVLSPIRAVAWLYLSFCIASEIGMSGVDLSHAWKGLVIVVVTTLLMSLLSFVGKWVAAGVCLILPVVFAAHALMAMGILVAFAMLVLVKAVW